MYKFKQTRAFCLLGIFMSGKEFNEKHPGKSYKFLNDNLKHYDMTYKQGLNKDHIPFELTSMCDAGGLYFTQNPARWMDDFGSKMAYVSVPNDAKVYVWSDKSKADRIILSEIIDIKDMKEWDDLDFCLDMVKHNVYYFKYVKNQTNEICLEAVKKNGLAIKIIKNQTCNVCVEAVRQNEEALGYINSTYMRLSVRYYLKLRHFI